ncbi:MAG TPA: hypothetical protein VG735_00210 [Caulobacterales bacterium]|nr:hypothetical protein [Caulobacterales bacterium]
MQQFLTTSSWSKNKGSREAAVSFSDTVAGVLNAVIAQSGSKLLNMSAVRTGEYGTYKRDYVYYDKAGYIAYRTDKADTLINAGAFMSVSDLLKQMMGGDVYAKRALASTILQAGGDAATLGQFGSFEINVLTGNLSTAADYASYLQNSAAINALIAAEPESAFSAGWIITFARAMELGLDRRGATDWVGGWNAFLDETADGKIDGKAFVPTNLSFELDPDSNERLFVFTDAEGALVGVPSNDNYPKESRHAA